jgi:site-specific DNA-methyltransferase (adenine-specific)
MKLILGDCIEKMAELPMESVDCVVTDPPYGINFLGKAWDGKAIAEAAAKPVNLGGSRRLTGSPDSPNRKMIERTGSGFATLAGEAGAYDFSLKGNRAFQKWCDQWGTQALYSLKPGGHMVVFGGPRTYHRMAAGLEDAGLDVRDCLMWLYGQGFPKSHNLPGGLGTALKPAWEPIILARKPLRGTVEDTVTSYGTGALNIDETRVGQSKNVPASPSNTHSNVYGKFGTGEGRLATGFDPDVGRWPANLLLTHHPDCVHTGHAVAPGRQMNRYVDGPKPFGGGKGHESTQETMPDELVETWECAPGCPVGGIGEESRFFYCPKVTGAEKHAGVPGGNYHPTVKPVELMRWLVRLVCPPDGTVLDCFMGSGTTAVASVLENRKFIGIEQDKSYMSVAKQRIAYWQLHGEEGWRLAREEASSEAVREKIKTSGQMDLWEIL